MIISCVRETSTSTQLYESEVARRWYALPPGLLLPLSNGDSCQLVFAGRPGSTAGPDVRDAVLQFRAPPKRCVGDVEFHINSSDWFVHQHATDVRYNSVILHVVLICNDTVPATRQDGTVVPVCSLYDLPFPAQTSQQATWPCHAVMQHMNYAERTRLLRLAGLLRFEQKTHAFVEILHQENSHSSFSAYDICLITALAEGMGYGRDRTFFHAAGRYLLGLSTDVPEPLGRACDPPPLDAQRLAVLRKLVEEWRIAGAWQSLRSVIFPYELIQSDCKPESSQGPGLYTTVERRAQYSRGDPCGRPGGSCGRPAGSCMSCVQNSAILHNLRTIFSALGMARADILICNVVLPFAAAVALIENDSGLAERAQTLYKEYPGLSSNRVTRAMQKQLHLKEEPREACQQQGLHYIYQQTCRAKLCDMCIAGRRKI